MWASNAPFKVGQKHRHSFYSVPAHASLSLSPRIHVWAARTAGDKVVFITRPHFSQKSLNQKYLCLHANPALSENLDSGSSREGGKIATKLHEESFFHFPSKHPIYCSIFHRYVLSEDPPITSPSPALSILTIVFKVKETLVLPRATTHPLYGRNWFWLPQKHTCC